MRKSPPAISSTDHPGPVAVKMRAKRFQAENLGSIAYGAKTLDGLFYSQNRELYLLSGTEVAAGSESQAFVYNVS